MPSGLSRWEVTSQQYRISLSLPSPVPFLRRLLKKHYIAECQNQLFNSGLSGKYSVSLYVHTCETTETFSLYVTNFEVQNEETFCILRVITSAKSDIIITRHLVNSFITLRVHTIRTLAKIIQRKRRVTERLKKLHTIVLHDFYSSSDVIMIIKSKRIGWAECVARMGEKRNVCRLPAGNLGERRLFE